MGHQGGLARFAKRYITQRGSVGTWTGLGFNICVVPTLMFCPCILEGQTDWGSERERGDEGIRM